MDIQQLKDLPNTDLLLYELLFPFGFTSWGDITKLLDTTSGKFVVSATHRVLKDRDTLIVSKLEEGKNEIYEVIQIPGRIEVPISMNFQEVKEMGPVDDSTIYVDKDRLKFPLQLRKWDHGDVFHPFGLDGKKKLSKFFKDEKLSLVAKEKVWILTSGEKIVWVIGLRADDRFRVGPETEHIVQIKCHLKQE